MARKKIEELFVPVNYGTNLQELDITDEKVGIFTGRPLIKLRVLFPECKIWSGLLIMDNTCTGIVIFQHIESGVQIRFEHDLYDSAAVYISRQGFGRHFTMATPIKRTQLWKDVRLFLKAL